MNEFKLGHERAQIIYRSNDNNDMTQKAILLVSQSVSLVWGLTVGNVVFREGMYLFYSEISTAELVVKFHGFVCGYSTG